MAVGGHLNPCFTIAHWLFRGFPARKVPMYVPSITARLSQRRRPPRADTLRPCLSRYILAQIFGAYVAFGLIYVQYYDFIHVSIF
jgi:glycerol uptake facilitator-like aquaporin